MHKKRTMKYLTVEDINDFEEELIINSPRSIEACLQEGIKPKDLLYVPEKEFNIPSVQDEIKHLHYEFFEAKRKEMLFNVRKTRKTIITENEGATRSSTASMFTLPYRKNKEEIRSKNIKIKAIEEKVNREIELQKYSREGEIEYIEKLERNLSLSISQAENSKKRFLNCKKLHLERLKKAQKEEEENEDLRRYLENKELKKLQNIIETAQEK